MLEMLNTRKFWNSKMQEIATMSLSWYKYTWAFCIILTSRFFVFLWLVSNCAEQVYSIVIIILSHEVISWSPLPGADIVLQEAHKCLHVKRLSASWCRSSFPKGIECLQKTKAAFKVSRMLRRGLLGSRLLSEWFLNICSVPHDRDIVIREEKIKKTWYINS